MDSSKENKLEDFIFGISDLDRIKSLVLEKELVSLEKIKEIETMVPNNAEEQKKLIMSELQALGPDQICDFFDILCKTDRYDAPVDSDAIPQSGPSTFHPMTHPFTVKKADKVKAGENIYPMKSKTRGPCIIINNVDFIYSEKRESSDLDAEKLKDLFEQLHFKVRLERNLQASQMKNALDQIRKEYQDRKPDCIVVIILSHGGREVVYGVDEEPLTHHYMMSVLSNNALSFQGVPKVFIVQACHGDSVDYGVPCEAVNDGGSDRKDYGKIRMATFTDILVAHSAVRGYVSFLNTVSGGWFTSELVAVFVDHAHDTHLVDLLKKVAERVSKRQSHHGEWQTPTIELIGWTKELYFNPGFQE